MKKLLLITCAFSLLSFISFAQDAVSSDSAPDVKNGTEKAKIISDFRIGGFFNFEPAVGDLSNYVFSSIGGGFSLEAGIPITDDIPVLNTFGIALRGTFNTGLMKETHVNSLFNMRYMVGAYSRIPLPGEMFTFMPEFDYGIALNMPKSTSPYVKPFYADQVMQLALGLGFSHKNMLKGNLEFDFTPTYTLSPEKNTIAHYIGFRFGVVYKVIDSNKTEAAPKTEKIKAPKEPKEPKVKTPWESVVSEENAIATEAEEKSETSEKKAEKPKKVSKATVKQINNYKTQVAQIKKRLKNISETAAENDIKNLKKINDKQFEKLDELLDQLNAIDTKGNAEEVEAKVAEVQSVLNEITEEEKAAQLELDMAITEKASKSGHAAVIRHPDGSISIAIPALTFETNSVKLENNKSNTGGLDTLVEVLLNEDILQDMTISVIGYINPDSKSDNWSDEEKAMAQGRAQTVVEYLKEHGCKQKFESMSGSGYTDNREYNRRVEIAVHK